jgi:hypothetical protein
MLLPLDWLLHCMNMTLVLGVEACMHCISSRRCMMLLTYARQ